MSDLATADDVARALGLEGASALSPSQSVRVAGLLSRVSHAFRREAEREFTPGTSTVRLITVGGRVRLVESVDDVEDVTSATIEDEHGDPIELTYTLHGQELALERDGCPLWSGLPVTVTYTHSAAMPESVVADVAAIVARHLTVDPSSAQVADERAGVFERRYADWWVRRRAYLLTEEEIEQARSYRNRATNVIIQRP